MRQDLTSSYGPILSILWCPMLQDDFSIVEVCPVVM